MCYRSSELNLFHASCSEQKKTNEIRQSEENEITNKTHLLYFFIYALRKRPASSGNNYSKPQKKMAVNAPLEDRKLFHICTSVECLPPVVATYQDEHKEWPSCKLSLQQQQL